MMFIKPPKYITTMHPCTTHTQTHAPTHAWPNLPVVPATQISHHDRHPVGLHDIALHIYLDCNLVNGDLHIFGVKVGWQIFLGQVQVFPEAHVLLQSHC